MTKRKLPLMFNNQVMGYSIYDVENNTIEVSILEPTDELRKMLSDKSTKEISIGFNGIEFDYKKIIGEK